MIPHASLEQAIGSLILWFAYYSFRDSLKITGQSWVFILFLFPIDVTLYYPVKLVIAVVGKPRGTFVLAIIKGVGQITLIVLGGVFRGVVGAPRRIRLLRRGFDAAREDMIQCAYCEAPIATVTQRTCPCGRVFVANLMEQCRCGDPDSAIPWIDCPTCGCSNDLR